MDSRCSFLFAHLSWLEPPYSSCSKNITWISLVGKIWKFQLSSPKTKASWNATWGRLKLLPCTRNAVEQKRIWISLRHIYIHIYMYTVYLNIYICTYHPSYSFLAKIHWEIFVKYFTNSTKLQISCPSANFKGARWWCSSWFQFTMAETTFHARKSPFVQVQNVSSRRSIAIQYMGQTESVTKWYCGTPPTSVPIANKNDVSTPQ